MDLTLRSTIGHFSDRGVQFTTQLWSTTAELLGIKLHHATAYHPQANGMVEHFHGHLMSALQRRLEDPNRIDALPWVVLGIRTAPKEDLNTSSAELVNSETLVIPGVFIPKSNTNADSTNFLQQLRKKSKPSFQLQRHVMAFILQKLFQNLCIEITFSLDGTVNVLHCNDPMTDFSKFLKSHPSILSSVLEVTL